MGKARKFGSTSDEITRIKKVASNGLIESIAENDPWASSDNGECAKNFSILVWRVVPSIVGRDKW